MLVTAYHKLLVTKLRILYEGIPDAPSNVEFRSLGQIIRKILRRFDFKEAEANKAFDVAYERTVPGTSLAFCSKNYLRDEVERVIKGRLASHADYTNTGQFQRVGRQLGLKKSDRETCWQLSEAWDQEMTARNTRSFPDTINDALKAAVESGTKHYRAALVDESQDMTASALQLIRVLVTGKTEGPIPENGFLLLEDKAQQLYPGGFRPGWIGLNFRGRSFKLEHGRRTTRQIAEAAAAVRGQWLVDKSDEEDIAVSVGSYETDGSKPCWIQTDAEMPEVESIIRGLVDKPLCKHEEIGILMRRKKDIEACCKYLKSKKIPAIQIKSERGDIRNVQGVQVVTLDSSKGLEFKAVIICRLGASLFPLTEKERKIEVDNLGGQEFEEQFGEKLSPEVEELQQLNLDRLYVGMTRAREMLFLLASEHPCKQIEKAAQFFEWYPLSKPFDLESAVDSI